MTFFNCQVGGCALLNLYDADNDGKVTASDALRAQNDGLTAEEVQFILNASAAGSINAVCPGCYTPAEEPEKKTPWILYLIIAGIAAALLG